MRILIAFALSLSFSLAADMKLGKPLTLKQATAIATVLASPDRFVGKTIQVRGKVVEVCQHAGCWMNLSDEASGKMVRIKVEDGEIVFPKDSVGKTAVAEGKFTRIQLTIEQAIAQMKHEAEMNNRKFDPASVKGGVTIYQVQGTGAVIKD